MEKGLKVQAVKPPIQVQRVRLDLRAPLAQVLKAHPVMPRIRVPPAQRGSQVHKGLPRIRVPPGKWVQLEFRVQRVIMESVARVIQVQRGVKGPPARSDSRVKSVIWDIAE